MQIIVTMREGKNRFGFMCAGYCYHCELDAEVIWNLWLWESYYKESVIQASLFGLNEVYTNPKRMFFITCRTRVGTRDSETQQAARRFLYIVELLWCCEILLFHALHHRKGHQEFSHHMAQAHLVVSCYSSRFPHILLPKFKVSPWFKLLFLHVSIQTTQP